MSNEQESKSPPADDQPVAAGRRRLLKASLAAAPVVVTLQSKPVLGGNLCHSTSGTMSGAMSQKAKTVQTCNGLPCSHWRNTGSPQGRGMGWVGIRPDSPFHPTFRQGSAAGSRQLVVQGLNTRSMSMYEILCATPDRDPHGICRHFVAALLNINSGRVPRAVMDVQRLLQVWVEWSRSGFYRPSAISDPWDAADLVHYFKSTGIAP